MWRMTSFYLLGFSKHEKKVEKKYTLKTYEPKPRILSKSKRMIYGTAYVDYKIGWHLLMHIAYDVIAL